MRKKRDIVDYLQIFSGLAVTAFTIYFFLERLRQKKLQDKKALEPKPEQSKIGVIID